MQHQTGRVPTASGRLVHAVQRVPWSSAAIPALIAIGFAFMSVWSDLVGHASGLVESADLVGNVTNARVFFLCGLTANSVFCWVFPRWNKHADAYATFVAALVSCAVTFAFSFPLLFPFLSAEALCIVCLFLIGFGYGWIVMRLVSQLAQEANYTTVVVAIISGLLLKTILVSCFSSFLPALVQTIIVIACPAVAMLMVYLSQRLLDANEATIDIAELPKLHHAEKRVMVIALVTVAIMRAMVRILSNMGFWGSGYVARNIVSGFDFVVIIVLLGFFSWVTLVREQEGDLVIRVLTPFLVVLGGFFFLDPEVSGFLGIGGGFDYALNVCIELFSCVMHWSIIILAIRQLDVHPYRVVGISYTVYGVSSITFALILQNAFVNTTLVVLGMYFFFVALLLIFRTEHKASEQRRRSRKSARMATEDDRVSELASTAGLTPRESEIFALLAQGRSRTYIQNELFLAEGTVKTHTSRIYRKLGINSKQDLITLVRGEEDEGEQEG